MKKFKQALKHCGLFFMFLPFLSATAYFIIEKFGQINSLIIAFLLIPTLIIFVVGIILHLIFEKRIRIKVLSIVLAFVSIALILPTSWLIQSIKQTYFLTKNKDFLEDLALDVLDKRVTIETANILLDSAHINMTITECHYIQDRQVLFTLSKFIDNCYGIAYCDNCTESKLNCCGELTSWVEIDTNWYKWTTT
jgi:hypothetical protein